MGVAIIGMGPREHDLSLIGEMYELWGMSWDNEWVKMDVLFDMHSPDWMEEVYPNIVERNQEVWVPLIMQEEYYENATAYPFKEVIEIGADYFTCSTAYMLAMAIFADPAEIHLHGITGTEDYEYQRPCIEYWIGVAKGKNINVFIHGESDLMKAERYGLKR